MGNNLRMVLDTNVFLVSILPRHKYWWVFDALMNQKFDLLVSNEILTEYLEKCVQKYGTAMANERLDFLLELPNVELVTPYFEWNFIAADPTDNKFVDCAVAGSADFLVTHDRHFNVLKDIAFPKIEVIRLEAFHQLLFQ